MWRRRATDYQFSYSFLLFFPAHTRDLFNYIVTLESCCVYNNLLNLGILRRENPFKEEFGSSSDCGQDVWTELSDGVASNLANTVVSLSSFDKDLPKTTASSFMIWWFKCAFQFTGLSWDGWTSGIYSTISLLSTYIASILFKEN